jgi:tetratricopeptide (TPR) repeat protein/DNA-binding SARP family transcriptional activator
VGQLRRLFASAEPGPDRLTRHGAGHLLRAEPDELDLLRFTAHVTTGRDKLRRRDSTVAAARFADALACWTDTMLAGLSRGPGLVARCTAVEDERLVVTEDLAALHMELDQPRESVGVLREVVRAHPLRERARLLIMRALHRLGDTSAALATYNEGRSALDEQLGLEPGPELQELHQAICAQAADPAPRKREPVPAQLPLDVYGFTGRRSELAQLDAVLAAASQRPTTVVISAISGTAGVGKTATAVHWAHRVLQQFPDGQLYVNLRGFDPSGTPMQPADAVRGFLDALAVPPSRVPADLDAQIKLYRSLLTGRRVLVVLDNARDSEQVGPLLPGTPGNLTLVTSRSRLSELTTADSVRPITLDVLTAAEARALLTKRLNAERVAAEVDAVDEIIDRCARLPLALTIVAARAAARPRLPLRLLAEELQDSRGALDTLNTDDTLIDIRAVFFWSYRALSPDAARLFRLLGLHPGPDLGVLAAASLAGLPVSETQPLLAELTHAHLLSEHVPGRYTFHDLLRAYATDQATVIDVETGRHTALCRLLDHYLHTAYAAARLLEPNRDPLDLTPLRTGVTVHPLADIDEAIAWFTAERRSLLAAIGQAVRAGLDIQAWKLATAMREFFLRRGFYKDWFTSSSAALAAAQRLGDRQGQALIHRGLGAACALLNCDEDASAHFRRAQGIYADIGDYVGQARVSNNFSWLAGLRGRSQEALEHSFRQLDQARKAGHRVSEGRALDAIGLYKAQLGDYRAATGYLHRCLSIQQEIDDRVGQSSSWFSLGFAYHRSDQHRPAIDCYERAIGLNRALGERSDEATTLDHLGDTHVAVGAFEAAREVWNQALTILVELDHPDAADIRTKLSRLPTDQTDRPATESGLG